MEPKVALQLWSVKEECEQDFIATLKQVKEMGYDGVEFAGYYGFEAGKLKEVLTELDLAVAGSHIPFEKIAENLDEVIEYEQILGNQLVICPYFSGKNFDEWQACFDILKAAEKRLAEHGLQLTYHNHSHEFTEIVDKDILVEMLHEIPEIKLEVDTYWVQSAGRNVIEWLETNQQRIALLHIKDMLVTGDKEESTEIGSGILPISSYVALAVKLKLPWLVVEQEAFQKYQPMESAALNVNTLKKIVREVMK